MYFYFRLGTDVMLFKKFRQKMAKKLAFLAQTTATFCKNFIITMTFEKNANLSAKNWRKSQKIVMITSSPHLGHFAPNLDKCPKTKKDVFEIIQASSSDRRPTTYV
jgi:hypothetical protein